MWVLWVALLASSASQARAEPLWAMGRPTTQAGDEALAQTFHELLRDKLRVRMQVRIIELQEPCAEIECVRSAAAPHGAEAAAQASLKRLGAKVIASLTVVEVASGATRFSDSLGTQTVEELDVVAERLVDALASGGRASDGAELGTITDEEERAPRRRDGRVAFLLGFQGVVPVQGYATELGGAGVELGVWFESMRFAIAPTLGMRFDLSRDDDKYFHVPIEVSGSYLFSRGDVAPLIGLGFGMHYLHEEVHVTSSVGEILVSESTDVIEDSVWGFSSFVRVGLLFLRTYDASLLFAVDYALTIADFEERSTEQAVRVTFDVLLGGS
jgi:hypothetical protein